LSPLTGIRVLECGEAYAVPYATRLLADLGAEVIRIESFTRPDSSRLGAFPDGRPSGEYWNQGAIHHEQNRNKRTFGLNLQIDEGKALLRALIATADIFAQNYAPRVMANLGLTYEALRPLRPDLIYLASSGYGQTGPWAGYVAWGTTLEPTAGLSHLTGFPDGPSVRNLNGGGTDMGSAVIAALVLLAALRHRDRTGEGRYIDLSQYEVGVSLTAEALLDHAVNGRVPMRDGNRDANRAPQGVYPCAGRENWVAISAGDDREWAALCAAMDQPDLAADPRFHTSAARHVHHDALDALLGAWTRDRDRWQIATDLQARGVPAGPVYSNKDLLLDPHLRARAFYRPVPMHPRAERVAGHLQSGPAWHLSETPVEIRRGAPVIGEDNAHILVDLLGRPPADLERLRAEHVLDTAPPPELRATSPAMPMTLEEMVASQRALAHDPDYLQVLEALHGLA
jgi:crotonobetainyl-CoA:carnitine CoA-transferase CaiB-like acyl-CoA transferase